MQRFIGQHVTGQFAHSITKTGLYDKSLCQNSLRGQQCEREAKQKTMRIPDLQLTMKE